MNFLCLLVCLIDQLKFEAYPNVFEVCGRYHSGKSFLLNQMLEMMHAFEVGTSIEPETKVCNKLKIQQPRAIRSCG
jgi:hypothetical protein